jgi:hypothetical protein
MVTARLLRWALDTRTAGNTQSPPDSLASINMSTGCWLDVNYSDTRPQGSWSPGVHLDRTWAMAAAARNSSSGVVVERSWSSNLDAPPSIHNRTYVAAVHQAIFCWFKHAPRSTNWFWNELEAPARTAAMTLTFLPWLEQTGHEMMMLLKMSCRATEVGRTGANLVAEIHTQLLRAAATHNVTLMADGFDKLWSDLVVHQPTAPPQPPHGGSFLNTNLSSRFAVVIQDVAVVKARSCV